MRVVNDRDPGVRQRARRVTAKSLACALTGLSVLIAITFLSRGELAGGGASRGLLVLAAHLVESWPAILWVLAAWGWGYALLLFRPSPRSSQFLALSIGVAILLWLDHLLGWLGWLQGSHAFASWVILLPGPAALVHVLTHQIVSESSDIVEHDGAKSGFSRSLQWGTIIACTLPIAVLAVAATSAPGWLWDSEFGGFDVLEYHLQLPREWFDAGRIQPVNHNVYSFLPSYVEAAYYHLSLLWQPFAGGQHPAIRAALSCQMLHAAVTCLTVSGLVALIWSVLCTTHVKEDAVSREGWIWATLIASGLYLVLPWNVVTGSMAYNEQFVNLLFVGGLLAAWPVTGRSSSGMWLQLSRGAIVGFVAGSACGAKMTALGTVVIPVGIALAERTRWRGWLPAFVGMGLGGVVACGPWLARNWMACGNPIFPLGTGVFGSAHWTPEQVARFAHAHSTSHGIEESTERFAEMALFNEQWAGLWFVGVAAVVCVFLATRASRDTRSVMEGRTGQAIRLGGILVVQILFWMLVTHQQSRFLITSAVPLCAMAGLAVGRMWEFSRRPRPIIPWAVTALVGAGALWTVVLFQRQRGGLPTAMVDWLDLRSGHAPSGMQNSEILAMQDLFAEAYVNARPEMSGYIYLLGDSTPYYFRTPVIYHTTYDKSPLGELVRAHDGDAGQWVKGLQSQGVKWLLVNFSELERLSIQDAWYDPAVTLEVVREFLGAHATFVKGWPADRPIRSLYRLDAPEDRLDGQ